MLCGRNFVFGPRAKSACKLVKQRLEVWISCCFGSAENFLSPWKWQQQVHFFETCYRPNLCDRSIGFLNMGWSTFHGGNNEASLIKFGVHLDLRKHFPKQQKAYFVTNVTLTLTSRVLQNFLNNMSWSKCKSWSKHCGEEHTKSWLEFDHVLIVNFEFHCWSSMCWHCHLGGQLSLNP
jgi:hypothetical protein